MKYLQILIDNWYVILALVVVVSFATHIVMKWLSKPSKSQIADIKEWLKYAVTEAEKHFGSGTGEIKLRYVYDQALKTFPWVGLFVSFDKFKSWVSEALEWMENKLEENDSIAGYVINE